MTKLNFGSEPFDAYPEFDELETTRRSSPVRPNRAGMGRQRHPHLSLSQSSHPRTSVTIRPGSRPVFYDKPLPCVCPVHGTEFVRWMQSSLNLIQNLNLSVDGIMSPAVRNALRRFQKQHGLTADGIAGPETVKALTDAKRKQAHSVAESTTQSEFGTLELNEFGLEEGVNRSSREYAMWVQASLNRMLGLRLAVDGIVGPLTRSAIRSFQQRHGLLVDGIVGPQTEGALIAAGAGNPPGSSASPYIPPSTPAQPPVSTASRAQLAQQILNNSRITLGTSSSTPNGNPRQNIIDTANGRYAISGCYDFSKCGSTVYLSTKMLQALLTLANDGNSFYVTSFAGGRHGSGSDHYAGRAVDIGNWNGTSLSSPNSAHTAARNSLIAAGSSSSQTFNAYHDPDGNHKNHVHAAFY